MVPARRAIDIPQEVPGTACKSIEHRFSETVEDHIIDHQLNNSEILKLSVHAQYVVEKLIAYKAQLSSAADVAF
jgi:hypothetical protein